MAQRRRQRQRQSRYPPYRYRARTPPVYRTIETGMNAMVGLGALAVGAGVIGTILNK